VLNDAVRQGANDLRLEVEAGKSDRLNLMYQVTAAYYMPWEIVPPTEMGSEAMSIEVAYDRTDIAVDDTVMADVRVRYYRYTRGREVTGEQGGCIELQYIIHWAA
jgi:hypothetical protein